MSMLRNLTGLLAAIAIAVATVGVTAKPARADTTDDLFRFLLGAAAIAVLVSAYHERSTRPDRRYTARTLPDHCIETVRVRGRLIDVYNARCLRQAGMTRLPAYCERTISTDRGPRAVFSARCLYDAGYVAERPRRDRPIVLPAVCELTYRYRGERFDGYYADCLRREGLRNLPGNCSLRARLGDESILIYSAGCLFEEGYEAQRRWR